MRGQRGVVAPGGDVARDDGDQGDQQGHDSADQQQHQVAYDTGEQEQQVRQQGPSPLADDGNAGDRRFGCGGVHGGTLRRDGGMPTHRRCADSGRESCGIHIATRGALTARASALTGGGAAPRESIPRNPLQRKVIPEDGRCPVHTSFVAQGEKSDGNEQPGW